MTLRVAALCALLLLTLRSAAVEPAVTTVVNNDDIAFMLGAEVVGRYHHGPDVAKPYLWPLTAPGGAIVTRAWPMEKGKPGETTDHVHHKSAWFCHGDVIPEGVALKEKVKNVEGVDFWDEAKGHGVIATTALAAPGGGRVVANNVWRTADGVPVLNETTVIALRSVGDARLWVFAIDLTPAVKSVTFGDTKEGAFGVRVSDRLQVGDKKGGNPKSKITLATGATGEKASWGHRAPWCDYSGEIDGKPVGVAVFDDPSNPYPACWHVRDYGLMAANPFGRSKSGFPEMKDAHDLVKLAQGEHLKLRYGIYVHAGDVTSGKVADGFREFVKTRE